LADGGGWTDAGEPEQGWRQEDLHVVDGVRVWARERPDEPGVVDVELVEAPATGPAGTSAGVVPRHRVTEEEMTEIVRESVAYLTSDQTD
jgi:hypothetical protein